MIASILTTLFEFYDTIFQPILALGPYISITIFAASLALLFSLIYWKFLDKEKADKIKNKISDHQDKMKEARENDDQEATQKHLAETLELNQKFMLVSMRPMMVTMIFVMLIFPWLGATYSPTIPLDQVENNTYEGTLEFGQQQEQFLLQTQENTTTIEINEETYETGDRVNKFGVNWHIRHFDEDNGGITSTVDGPALNVAAEYYKLPRTLPLIGEGLNWLAFYIILVMPLSIAIRKALGVA